MSLVAGVMKDHLYMEALMNSSVPDERSDYAQDNMDYEDYRDATEGRCGFPWDNEDEDEDEATEGVAKHSLAIIAVNMVYAMTQDAEYVSPNDWVEFLSHFLGNGFAMEFVMSSWDDGEFHPY
jgi:hypothetical protein